MKQALGSLVVEVEDHTRNRLRDGPTVRGLDLEPHAIGQGDDALGATSVTLLGERLGALDDGVLDLVRSSAPDQKYQGNGDQSGSRF